MSGEDKPKLIIPEDPDLLEQELRKLGVPGGIEGVRDESSWRAAERLKGVSDSKNVPSDMMLQAMMSLQRQLSEFMAAQEASPEVQKKAPALTEDKIFYTKPVEVRADGTATAIGRMMFNMMWSRSLVHSSDMMFAAGGVVEALLNSGEEVAGVEGLRFLNPVKNDLELYACAGELSPDIAGRCAQRKPDLKGSFMTRNTETGESRKIQMVGFQNDRDARRNGVFTQMAYLPASLIQDFDTFYEVENGNGDPGFEFNLSEPIKVDTKFKLGTSLNTIMELVMYAVSNLRRAGIDDLPTGNFNLAYGFDFKVLPKLDELNENCELYIEIDTGGIVEKPNGFRFVPIKFELSDGDRIICRGVYTRAQGMNAQVASDYQRKL